MRNSVLRGRLKPLEAAACSRPIEAKMDGLMQFVCQDLTIVGWRYPIIVYPPKPSNSINRGYK